MNIILGLLKVCLETLLTVVLLNVFYQILYPRSLCFNFIMLPKEFSLAMVPLSYIVHSFLMTLFKIYWDRDL